jgi:hypothetical protein
MNNVITLGQKGKKGSKTVKVVDAQKGIIRLGGDRMSRPVGIVFGRMGKGDARKLRKALHGAGLKNLAGAPRLVG